MCPRLVKVVLLEHRILLRRDRELPPVEQFVHRGQSVLLVEVPCLIVINVAEVRLAMEVLVYQSGVCCSTVVFAETFKITFDHLGIYLAF